MSGNPAQENNDDRSDREAGTTKPQAEAGRETEQNSTPPLLTGETDPPDEELIPIESDDELPVDEDADDDSQPDDDDDDLGELSFETGEEESSDEFLTGDEAAADDDATILSGDSDHEFSVSDGSTGAEDSNAFRLDSDDAGSGFDLVSGSNETVAEGTLILTEDNDEIEHSAGADATDSSDHITVDLSGSDRDNVLTFETQEGGDLAGGDELEIDGTFDLTPTEDPPPDEPDDDATRDGAGPVNGGEQAEENDAPLDFTPPPPHERDQETVEAREEADQDASGRVDLSGRGEADSVRSEDDLLDRRDEESETYDRVEDEYRDDEDGDDLEDIF